MTLDVSLVSLAEVMGSWHYAICLREPPMLWFRKEPVRGVAWR
jgi:hypothetical protein